MRLQLVLVSLLLVAAATATTRSLANNQSFTIEGQTFTVFPIDNTGIQLGFSDNTTRIFRIGECIDLSYTRFCLRGASTTRASIDDRFIGPALTARQILDSTNTYSGNVVEGSVDITNTGLSNAFGVSLLMRLPEGLEFYTGNSKQLLTATLTIYKQASVPYTIRALKNGTYSFNATLTYFDGNKTVILVVPVRSFVAALPFSYKINYDNSSSGGNFQLNLTKRYTGNFSFTIIAQFPNSTVFLNTSNTVDELKDQVIARKGLNSTTTALQINITYAFRKPPTAPLVLTIIYDNGSEQIIRETYPFEHLDDPDPSLAVSIDPLVVNQTAALRIIVTGNHSGVLSISGDLFSARGETEPGLKQFSIKPLKAGNYTLLVMFNSTSIYGEQQIARGIILVNVSDTPLVSFVDTILNQTASNTTIIENKTFTPELTPATPDVRRALYVAAAAALVMLFILFTVIRHLSNPLLKLEHLVADLSEAANILEQKRRKQGLTSEERTELQAIQKQLRDLEKKL